MLPRAQHPHQLGLSAVELLIGSALSLMLLAGVITLFGTSRQTYEANERLARIQENGRFAIEQISRDIRSAGYKGCARRADSASPFHNRLFNETALLWNFGMPVHGYDATSTSAWNVTPDALIDSPVGGNDILIARRPKLDARTLQLNSAMGNRTADIVVTDPAPADINNGDVVLVGSCRAASVVKVTAYAHNAGAGTGTIVHAQGSGADVAVAGNLDTDAGYAYDTFASVVPVETVAYFVRMNAANVPSLYRRTPSTTEEIVEGVEAMQVQYGVDVDNDLWADQYRTAAEVTTSNQWGRVISVSVALLVRSATPYGADQDTRTYDLLGATAGPFNDRYQRVVFTTTATLRNQAK